jgi:dynactin-6
MSSSKRVSSALPAPKPPTSLALTCIVPELASLTGTKPISIRDHTVIHPRAKLISAYGPITIGSTCIISERSTVGLQSLPHASQLEGVVLKDYVVVEVGAVVEARSVGEGSVIEINAKVGNGAVIGKVWVYAFSSPFFLFLSQRGREYY